MHHCLMSPVAAEKSDAATVPPGPGPCSLPRPCVGAECLLCLLQPSRSPAFKVAPFSVTLETQVPCVCMWVQASCPRGGRVAVGLALPPSCHVGSGAPDFGSPPEMRSCPFCGLPLLFPSVCNLLPHLLGDSASGSG